MDLFLRENAGKFPDKTAVKHLSDEISYRALDSYVDYIASSLLEEGVEPGDRVAVYLEKSIDFVAAIFAVLRIDATYLPLDVRSPEARTRGILSQCPVSVLITRKRWRARFSENIPLFEVPEHSQNGIPGVKIASNTSSGKKTGEIPAYILFTSGSTGKPKGVVISRSAAMAFLDWSFHHFGLTSRDHFANFSEFYFDISTFDLFNSIRAGGTLHLIPGEMTLLPRKLMDYVVRNHISIWYSVPWTLIHLVRFGRPERYPRIPLRKILFAGEVFPIDQLKTVCRQFPDAEFTNLYGPTETNVCTFYPVPESVQSFTEPVPIGTACSGDSVYVVDARNALVPDGESGELVVCGPSVMTGYWNEKQLTERVFLDNIEGVGPGRYYRTGDIVRRNSDGYLVYLGRADGMVKRRGFRIELGEIESAAGSHPAVRECAATAMEEKGESRIKLFISGTRSVSELDMLSYLSERLPQYMIPDSIVAVQRLPRNANGKIDRKKLRLL